MERSAPAPLDLEFASLEDAISRAEDASNGFGALFLDAVNAAAPNLYEPTMFVSSAITRATGLHNGTVMGIRGENPHATFPLLRAYIELVAIMAHATDHPRYYRALMRDPRQRAQGDPKRQSMQALMNSASKRFPGIKYPYDHLCEIGHFGDTAYWMPFVFTPTSDPKPGASLGTIQASSAPRFRDDRERYIACAHLIEFADSFTECVVAITEQQLKPLGQQAY